MPHAPRSARECEGIDSHTPKGTPIWELESRWTPECSKNDCRGQNPMNWEIIGNWLKLRCVKWSRMTHFDIWNSSYGQKNGQESNWQFDSWPLKVGNWPDLLACKWRATYYWKALEESYNFAWDLVSIQGLNAKL
jgi:hypothetical protein